MYIFEGREPVLHPNTFVADGAKLIGAVRMHEFSSVWFNAILRGDINRIEIGRYSNIQDNSVLHVTDENATIVGDFVTVGHNATLHGCVVKEHCLIGMGAVVLGGAVIGEGSIVAAGAVVRENEMVPPFSLVAGVPAKVVKKLPEEWKTIHAQAVKYKMLWTKRYGVLPDAGGEQYHGEEIV
jgi:carbonic anhydrase/acetyltransferase-like protein (isoleucine patch superfamily)